MSANKLFRTAGWCALAGAIAMIAAMVFFMIAPMVGGILEYISLLLLVFVFCALYVAHRAESKWLSLAGLILLIAAIGTDVFSMANYGNSTLGNLWYLLFSFPFLIYGFLTFRNARMPRGPRSSVPAGWTDPVCLRSCSDCSETRICQTT